MWLQENLAALVKTNQLSGQLHDAAADEPMQQQWDQERAISQPQIHPLAGNRQTGTWVQGVLL